MRKQTSFVAAILVATAATAFGQSTTVPPDEFIGPYRQNALLSVANDENYGARQIAVWGDQMFVAGTGVVYAYQRAAGGDDWLDGNPVIVNQPGFGASLDFDGTRLIVGAQGAAYVFEQFGGSWGVAGVLPSNGFVSISGSRAMVGATIYALSSGGAWLQEAVLPQAGAISGDYVASTGLSGGGPRLLLYERQADGTWLLLPPDSNGMRQDPGGVGIEGMLVVDSDAFAGTRFWERQGAAWVLTQRIQAPFPGHGSIAIDGERAVLGAGYGNGAQIVAKRPEGWVIIANYKTGISSDTFGRQVSVSKDTVAIGAPRLPPGHPLGIGAWVYVVTEDSDGDGIRDGRDGPPPVVVTPPEPEPPTPGPVTPPEPEPTPEPPAPSPDPTPEPPTPTPEPPAPREGPPAPGPAPEPQPEPPQPQPEPPAPDPIIVPQQLSTPTVTAVVTPRGTTRAAPAATTGRVAVPRDRR